MQPPGNTDSSATDHTAMDHAEESEVLNSTSSTSRISDSISADSAQASIHVPKETEGESQEAHPSVAEPMQVAAAAEPATGADGAGSNPNGAQLHYLAMDTLDIPHPNAAEIIRQVEFYLGDENLPHDAHLLSFVGSTGDGWVSINRIFGFRKMRDYKPKAQAKAALRGSTFLEVDEKLKFVRRTTPLAGPLQVSPRESEETRMAKILIEKPFLSKNMLKPTGFEEGFAEGPLRPEEAERERLTYDPDESFTLRIDYAVAKYMSKRKMHQGTLQVFSKYLLFGGFDSSPRQFTGGFDQKDLENYTKDEILQMKARSSDRLNVFLD